MALRTILPLDFYVDMVVDGDLIGAYVVMHNCDDKGTCGTAEHVTEVVTPHTGNQIHVKCDQCGTRDLIQQ